ncbi:MAG: CXXX repeat peptide modification system protein [Ancalomicrobiaceae bacterium]|nr:CXXX repeat peptide modification system protein [Ancalomicrobiaceae bacterium]
MAKSGKKAIAAALKADRQSVGRVLPGERDEVLRLHERRAGLDELVLSLQESPLLANPVFYDKVVADLGRTVKHLADWWDAKAKKYGWDAVPGGQWSIDFDSCNIFLDHGTARHGG